MESILSCKVNTSSSMSFCGFTSQMSLHDLNKHFFFRCDLFSLIFYFGINYNPCLSHSRRIVIVVHGYVLK